MNLFRADTSESGLTLTIMVSQTEGCKKELHGTRKDEPIRTNWGLCLSLTAWSCPQGWPAGEAGTGRVIIAVLRTIGAGDLAGPRVVWSSGVAPYLHCDQRWCRLTMYELQRHLASHWPSESGNQMTVAPLPLSKPCANWTNFTQNRVRREFWEM